VQIPEMAAQLARAKPDIILDSCGWHTLCLPGQRRRWPYPCSVRSNLRSGRDGTGPKSSSTCWECDRIDHDKRRPSRKTARVDQRLLPSLHEGRDPGPRVQSDCTPLHTTVAVRSREAGR
jgi:hypothetical protein